MPGRELIGIGRWRIGFSLSGARKGSVELRHEAPLRKSAVSAMRRISLLARDNAEDHSGSFGPRLAIAIRQKRTNQRRGNFVRLADERVGGSAANSRIGFGSRTKLPRRWLV